MSTRREFLATAAAAALAACSRRAAPGAMPVRAAPARPLDLLILGGTGFIGPHLVRHAVDRGHHVTIFTRGRRTADLPAGVTHLIGDRDGDLSALATGRWDAVIDDSATRPDRVRRTAQLLKDRVGRYLFTSSTGVYYPYLRIGLSEADPVRTTLDDPKDGSADYGVAKALSERETLDTFGDRGVVVRPTYIIGPGDTSDRFPYWPVRLDRGGETLAPGPDDPAQWIDVRDLAAFMVRLVEDGRAGVYNAAAPSRPFRPFLTEANAALGNKARLVWVDDPAFLEAHGIVYAVPWALPKGNEYGMMAIDSTKAVRAGLTIRPVTETVRDTLAWWQTVPEARRQAPKFTVTAEQEAKALAEWKRR